MKEVVIMTREEYKAYQLSFVNMKKNLEETSQNVLDLEDEITSLRERIEELKYHLNKPAFDKLNEKHDTEFYAWCAKKAIEYERQDELEWCACRARFYNNGIAHYCACHSVSEEEAEEHRKWHDVMEYVWHVEETEGWTELLNSETCRNHISMFRYCHETWILSAARKDAWVRYEETKNKYKWCWYNPYWKLAKTFDKMHEECRCIDNENHEYYR